MTDERPVSSARPEMRDRVLVWSQLGLLALVALGPRSPGPEPGWTPPWNDRAAVLGLASGLAGAILMLAGALQIGPNLKPSPQPTAGAPLIRTGAYRIVRHPIYTGLILSALGWALFVNGGLTLLYTLALAVVLDIKSRYEERWLSAKYEDYADYQRRVSRLLPFIY